MKYIYAFIATLLLASCGSGGGGGFGGGAFNRTDDQPAGEFSVGKSTIQFKSKNCNAGVYELDQRLKVGSTRRTSNIFISDKGKMHGQGNVIETTVDRINFNSQSITATSKLTGRGQNLHFTETCKMGSGQTFEDLQCDIGSTSPGVQQYIQSLPKSIYCNVSGSSVDDTSEVGLYKFTNGQSIVALKTVYKIEGQVNCSGDDNKNFDAGPGTMYSLRIESFDVPSIWGWSDGCYPQQVFSYYEVRDKDGKPLTLYRDETVEFK